MLGVGCLDIACRHVLSVLVATSRMNALACDMTALHCLIY